VGAAPPRDRLPPRGGARRRVVVRTAVGHLEGLTFERRTQIRRARDGTVLAESRTLWCPVHARTGPPAPRERRAAHPVSPCPSRATLARRTGPAHREATPRAVSAPPPATRMTNVDVVRPRLPRYAAATSGDVALLDPAVEIVQTALLPWGGVHRGHDGARHSSHHRRAHRDRPAAGPPDPARRRRRRGAPARPRGAPPAAHQTSPSRTCDAARGASCASPRTSTRRRCSPRSPRP
jgi:hypothetical protein